MSGRWTVVVAGVCGIGLGCREASHNQGPLGHQDSPDAGGVTAGGSAGAGGGLATGLGGAGGASMTSSRSALVPPATAFAPGSVCEANGDCWYAPLPTGDFWEAVASAGRTDLWIGGQSSNVLHLGGGHWSAVPTPLIETVAIWGAAADDVWFGGRFGPSSIAALAHWDGQAITVTTQFSSDFEIADIWGTDANNVYAVGFGTGVHWDGRSWTPVAGLLGSSVSGSGPDDVWAGADDGIRHFDGSAWTQVPQFIGAFVQDLVVAGRNDVWAEVSSNGITDIEHFDGQSWTVSFEVNLVGVGGVALTTIGASGPGDVWVGGTRFDPTNQRGYLAHFDGTGWTVAPEAPEPIQRVESAPAFGVLAVGQQGGFVQLDATPTLGFTDERGGPSQNLTGVWGSSPADMWAVGRAGSVLHFDGTAVAAMSSGVTEDLVDVWGTAPDDVWIVGDAGTALHFDGAALTKVATGTTANLLAVFTGARGDVWMGGQASTLLHVEGGAVTPVALGQTPGSPLAVLDLHGLSSSDVWLSGGGDSDAGFGFQPPGFTAHFDGSAWSPVELQPASGFPFHRIWELAPNDVWVVTQLIFRDIVDYWHFDGTSWQEEQMSPSAATFMFPEPETALGSFVFGPHNRWTVGVLGAWERNTQ